MTGHWTLFSISPTNTFSDLCYGTFKDAYSASLFPPLGASDHNVVYLRPTYQRLLQREKPQERSVKVWNNDSIMALQGCFDCTNRDTFKFPDINEQVETISDYINVCVVTVIPIKKLNSPKREALELQQIKVSYN